MVLVCLDSNETFTKTLSKHHTYFSGLSIVAVFFVLFQKVRVTSDHNRPCCHSTLILVSRAREVAITWHLVAWRYKVEQRDND